jgi:putative ABC transport system permease protein
VLVTAKGCPYELATVALSGIGALRYLSADTIVKIRKDKDVSDLAPMLLNPLGKDEGIGFYSFWGVDLNSYNRLRPMIKIASGKHIERIVDSETGQEMDKELDGPMGRWFKPRDVQPDEVHLKNGKVVRGLIVGEGKFEKVVGQELDPVTGDYIEKKRAFRTVKIMLPSRVYNKADIREQKEIMRLKDGTTIEGAVSKENESSFKVVTKNAQGGEEETTYPSLEVVRIEDILTLHDSTRVAGVIIGQTADTYIVGDIEFAYPTTEEISYELIQTDPQGNKKIVQPEKLNPQTTEVVLGWEAAQTGFIKVGQHFTLKTKEMRREKSQKIVQDPETGKSKQIEIEVEKLVPKSHIFKVVGILERSGSKDDGSYFIQLEEAQRIFKKYKMLTGVGIILKDLARLPMFTDRLYNQKELGEIQIVSLSEVKGTILNLVQTAKILVMSVAFIAIFVALIGVINTILMSVFERTKEIGIMKAIGASRMDIFKLIWLETIFICVLGGCVGIFLAVLGGNYIEKSIRLVMSRAGYVPEGQIITFSLEILIGCFFGAIALGVLSGIWPAYRAAKMSPIEAIRSGE